MSLKPLGNGLYLIETTDPVRFQLISATVSFEPGFPFANPIRGGALGGFVEIYWEGPGNA